MKVPFFGESKTVSLAVPRLDGGMTVTDAPWQLEDAALSDCRNMWFQDGTLRTRDGFWTSADWAGKETPYADVNYVVDTNGWLVGISHLERDGESSLTVTARAPSGGEEVELLTVSVPLGTTYACVPSVSTAEKDTLLLYVSDGRIWALRPSAWEVAEVTSRIYVPTVMIGGHPLEGRLSNDSGGRAYQQRNRLTDRVRCSYTPDGVGTYYYLPYRHIQGELHVWVSGLAGSVWEYHVAANENVSAEAEGRTLVLERDNGLFYFRNKAGENVALSVYGTPDSVVVEYRMPMEKPLVCGMTFGVWYGGDKSTIGGHRLFLSGNPEMPHAVIWSVAENPFYFPENACVTIGLSDKAITAFGKQDGSLVMFKENETYVAEYVRGTGSITDTSEPLLPTYAIHTAVGCDCPQTVALLGGRLTWSCKDGNVYQLKAPSSYGNRGIVTVGDPIRPLLRDNDGSVCARVWDGNYYLLYGWTLWVLTNAEKQTWYRFVWPENGTNPCGLYDGTTLRILAKAGRQTFWFSPSGAYDVHPLLDYRQLPVIGAFCTKFYDFGSNTYKRIRRVRIQSRSSLTPQYHTEYGSYRDGTHRPDAGGMVVCAPHLPRCRRWALELEGEGLAVGSIDAVAHTEGEWA